MARPDTMRQIRRFCLDCQGNSSPEIQRCRDTDCRLWPWRLGKLDAETSQNGEVNSNTALLQRKALRVVRGHCLTCAGHRKDVRLCTAREQCPLWSLRFGVYPSTYKRVKARIAQGKRLSLFEG